MEDFRGGKRDLSHITISGLWDRIKGTERMSEPVEFTIEDAVKELLLRMESVCNKSDDEVEQILGKALGMPWYKDDQKNFPGATEENGVCVGEHIPVSIALAAARRIEELEGLLAKILASGLWYPSALEIDTYSKTGFNNGEEIEKAIRKTLGITDKEVAKVQPMEYSSPPVVVTCLMCKRPQEECDCDEKCCP